MISFLKNTYRSIKKRVSFFFKVNWYKTLYFNYKKFPFSIAKKLPVYFYGSVKFTDISGSIKIEAPIKKAMIGFGQPYEFTTRSQGIDEIVLKGKVIFKGHVQFGKDIFLYVDNEAILEMGHLSSIASRGKIICTTHIILGDYARLGSECQIIDTNFHQMIDTISGEKLPMSGAISIGNRNFISNRVTILSKTITPSNCTIASNTLCTKDYSSYGENVLIGGIPAKLLRENITRDWDSEMKLLEQYLIV